VDAIGIEEDFARWYRTAHPHIVAALVSYSGDLAAATEATDEAFSRAFAEWTSVGCMTSPIGWTFVVAGNLLRRHKRRWRLESERMGAEARTRSTEESDDADVVLALEVAEALRRLTKRQRDVVVLHHGLDLSQDDVAALLGISRSTVATTLMDARRVLHNRANDAGASIKSPKGGQRA
jgi:RNA polymerase sigma-70 factor, ECF subfamily